MDKRPRSKIRLRTAEIDRLLLAKGLTRARLAEKANIAARTLSRVLNGRGASLLTTQKLGEELGIGEDLNRIIESPLQVGPDSPSLQSGKVDPAQFATIVIPIPLPLFEDPQQLALVLEEIYRIVKSHGTIQAFRPTAGSVRIQLRFSEQQDIESLVLQFRSDPVQFFGIYIVEVFRNLDVAGLLHIEDQLKTTNVATLKPIDDRRRNFTLIVTRPTLLGRMPLDHWVLRWSTGSEQSTEDAYRYFWLSFMRHRT